MPTSTKVNYCKLESLFSVIITLPLQKLESGFPEFKTKQKHTNVYTNICLLNFKS